MTSLSPKRSVTLVTLVTDVTLPAEANLEKNLSSLFRVEAAELKARLRSMQMATRILCGPRARTLELALSAAERDEAALSEAMKALEALAPLDRRRVLASWGSVTWRQDD